MSKKYNTKEEADAAVVKLGESVLSIFCPLNHGACSPRCPCFQPPYVNKSDNVFYVDVALCNNAMFFNTCQYGC